MSKRKWKVYTTDELKDRFQPKPGSNATTSDDQKVVVPNLKRRNSAPPGMIHFPPGTFSASSQNIHQTASNAYQPSSPHQQHELVTHARSSPTSKSHPYPSRLDKRRASLPYIPPDLGSSHATPPSIEAYLTHLQQMPLAPHPDDSPEPSLDPSLSLPSFQSLLRTIKEDQDEDDSEIREIEERANGSPTISSLQTSKTLPLSYKDMHKGKADPHAHYQPFAFPPPADSHSPHFSHSPSSSSHSPSSTHSPSHPSASPGSPSSKFYKNNALAKSNETLPSLSRMSINDIIG